MKDLKDLYKRYLEIQKGQPQNMADGGKAESNDSILNDLADKLKKAFSAPPPKPPKEPSLEEKYQKIREQNQKNFTDPSSQPLANGGLVLPRTIQYAEGGKVEHNLKNLQELKAAFDKFISEESAEKMASGGKVGSGERFAALENKLSHQKGVTDPAALAASIGRKKYGNAKMNKMAHAHMNEGGSVPGFVPEGDIKHYDDGGQIPAPAGMSPEDAAHAAQLKKIFPDWDDAKIQMMMQRTDPNRMPLGQPKQPIPQPEYMNPVPRPAPVDSGNLGNNINNQVAQMQVGQGMADGGAAKQSPEEIAAAAENADNTGYAPEDALAEQMAQESTPGEIENELSKEASPEESKDEPEKELASEEKDNSDDSEDDADEESALPVVEPKSDKAAGLQVNPDIQKLIESAKQNPDALKEVQAARDQMIANQQIEKGAALAGAGIAGRSGARVDPSQALNVIGEGDKYVNLPVQKYEEQIKNQQNDPNSPMSQAVKGYLTSKGMKIPDNASAADLFKVAPLLQKDAGLQMALKKVEMQQLGAKERNENSVSSANKRAKEANDLKAQENKIRQDQLKAVKEQNQSNKENFDFEKMGKLATAETSSSRSAFGKAANVVRSAEQLEALGKQYGDLNQLDNRQIAEIARGLDAMLASGAATVTGAAHLLPNTASGSLAKIEEYITSLPAGTKQKEFVKRMMDTVEREKKIANDQMIRTQGKILAPFSHLKKNNPDRYNATLKSMGIPTEEDQAKYTKDVTDYAQEHNISPDQALAIKMQRTGGQ